MPAQKDHVSGHFVPDKPVMESGAVSKRPSDPKPFHKWRKMTQKMASRPKDTDFS